MRLPPKYTVPLTALLSLFALSSAAYAQVTAADFGGDYSESNDSANSTLTYDNGDFDGEADATDRRGFIAIGTEFKSITDANAVGNNTVINAGFQSTYLDSTFGSPLIGIYRLLAANGVGNPDSLQAGTGSTDFDGNLSATNFTPNVTKDKFLNGADNASSTLGFENAAGSATITIQAGVDVIGRALVQSGANWYISDTSIAGTFPLTLSINGFTETWYPYDPDTNMYINAGTLSGGVLGSTLTDIQAFGAACQINNTPAGLSSNDEIIEGKFKGHPHKFLKMLDRWPHSEQKDI